MKWKPKCFVRTADLFLFLFLFLANKGIMW